MNVNRSLVKRIMAHRASEINAISANGTLFHATISETDIPIKELKALKRRGVNFNALDVCGYSILFIAIVYKRSNDCVMNLIKLGANPKFVSPEGDTLLHLAALHGNLELATYLISVGCDVNPVNKEGDAPLHNVFGAITCYPQLAKLFLENGANIHTKGSLGYTPAKLMVHLENVSFELMQVLQDHGADFNSTDQDPSGGSLLHVAVHFKHSMDFIRNLVQLGADPKVTNNQGQTSLFVAVVKGYVEAAEYLISVGCDVNTADKEGYTPLHVLFTGTANSVPMAKLLLSKGANVNIKNDEGETPVAFAILHRTSKTSEEWPLDYFKVLDLLKEYGADFSSVTNDGISPLAGCILKSGSKVLFQKLIDLEADPEFVFDKQDNMTLLHLVANNFDLETAGLLLSSGVNINKKDNNGKNALFYVFENRHYSELSYAMIKCLVEGGIDFDSRDNNGLTFLHMLSIREGHFNTKKVFKLLKKHGADFNCLDNKQRSPLEYAISCKEKSIEFITSLLDHGADPKITFTKDGTHRFTSLHSAVIENNLELVSLLISRGCDVNDMKNSALETPLHTLIIASVLKNDVFEIAKLLLDNGVDPNIESGNGRTVLDEAMRLADGYVEQKTIELLISRGARNSKDYCDCVLVNHVNRLFRCINYL